jgi:hypothetical protein
MSFLRSHFKLVAVALSCVAVGAAASAIATAGAATPAAGSSARAAHRGRAARAVLMRAVHGNLVLATKKGFVTVTFDRGLVQSVQGQQLTLVEGNAKGTHKSVTLTIPTNAIVRDNGKVANLSAVKAGQRVRVVQGLGRTRVVARTPRRP